VQVQAWQGPRPVWDRDDWHPQIATEHWELGRASGQRELAAAHARIGLAGPVLYSIVLYWFAALRCLGLPWVALVGERLNPSVELSPAGSISATAAVSETGTTERQDRTDWARRDETSQQNRAEQSRAPARNVTSTWGLGARLWRRPITAARRSVVCRAALARSSPARRPLAARSSLMARLVAR
jgi:hypothetical protein